MGIEPAGSLKVSVNEKSETLSLSDIFSIEFNRSASLQEADRYRDFVVQTDWGGCFSTRALETVDGKLKCHTAMLGDIALPIAVIRSIRRTESSSGSRVKQEFDKTVAANPGKDVLQMEGEHGPISLAGIFHGIQKTRFIFRWQESDREIDAQKVLALSLVSAAERPQISKDFVALISSPQIVALNPQTETRGEVWPGKLGAITAASITLESPLLGTEKIPTQKIAALDFVFGRRTYVSDLVPFDVRETSFFGASFGWQRDATIEGRALRLQRNGLRVAAGDSTRREEFAKGLGTHARCELTYALNGRFRVLTGWIGVDAETHGRGSAEFIVLTGGREIFRSGEVKATDESRRIFVPLTGAQTLTLRTDFAGSHFDMGAHADWADLQLIE